MQLTVIMKTFICDYVVSGKICGYKSNNKSNFNKHQTAIHEEERFVCKLCGKLFLSRSGSNEHMKSAHSNERYKCDQDDCRETYVQMKSFRAHIKKNHGGLLTSKTISCAYKCTKCSKYFKYKKEEHVCLETSEKSTLKLVKGYKQYEPTAHLLNKRKHIVQGTRDSCILLVDLEPFPAIEVEDVFSDVYHEDEIEVLMDGVILVDNVLKE